MKAGRCPADRIVSSYLLHFTNERGSGLLQSGGHLGQGLATMPRPAGVRSGLCVLTTRLRRTREWAEGTTDLFCFSGVSCYWAYFLKDWGLMPLSLFFIGKRCWLHWGSKTCITVCPSCRRVHPLQEMWKQVWFFFFLVCENNPLACNRIPKLFSCSWICPFLLHASL